MIVTPQKLTPFVDRLEVDGERRQVNVVRSAVLLGEENADEPHKT